MPIIINEFEIVTEPPTPSDQAQQPQPTQPPPTLRPEDIERIQYRYQQRMARLRAT